MDLDHQPTARDCLHLANDIIILAGLSIPRLTVMQDINSHFFAELYRHLFNINIVFNSSSTVDQLRLIDTLITTLEVDLLQVNLDHLNRKAIFRLDPRAVFEFLEIVGELVKYLPRGFSRQNLSKNIDITDAGVQTDFDESHSKRINQKSRIFWGKISDRAEHEDNNNNHSLNDKEQSNLNIPFVDKTISKQFIDSDVNLEKLKQKHVENFVMRLGLRFQETLKLKENAKEIERNIQKFYEEPRINKNKDRSSVKKQLKFQRRNKKVTFGKKKVDLDLKPETRDLGLDELLLKFPGVNKATAKMLKQQETNQHKIVNNLMKDVRTNELKLKLQLQSAFEKQEKRSRIVRDDVRLLRRAFETKEQKFERIRENSAKRDNRLEKARLNKLIENYYNETMSKLKWLQGQEEKLVKHEFEKRFRESREEVIEFRNRIKEQHDKEKEKQHRLLEAFENLYQNKLELLSDNLAKEEAELRQQIASQSQYLRALQKEFREKLDNEIKQLLKV